MVICNVAKILELVVPLMEHPSETFLATIEEDLMKLIIKYGMTVSIHFATSVDQCTIHKSCVFKSLNHAFNFYLNNNIFSLLGSATLCKLSWGCCK